MELTKLVIKGFKSFGDRITINFNEGVTAIVGPNGCGKSNVVDAIRWVLGEQSTKSLRSEKMENIIFNGTKSRKPANLAEVSLTFQNSRNILPTEFTTVTITRKLYRTGESEYRLNDVKCRLKDITDLFLDTGIGTDTYSIIELKMIDEIIANKDNSRRSLFEEASGISKYKIRKKQTLARLKDTEGDLSRVDDLLLEIQKNLKTVENQAKKAKRHGELKAAYKEASTDLAYHRLLNFSEQLDELVDKTQQEETRLGQIKSGLDEQESALQQRKADILLQEQNVFKQQKVTQEYVQKIQQHESKTQLKNEQLRYLSDKEARLKKELDQDQQQREHLAQQQKRLYEDMHTEQAAFDRLQSALQKEQLEVEALRGQQQTAKLKLDSGQKSKGEKEVQAHELEKTMAVLRIRQESITRDVERHAQEAVGKEDELQQLNERIGELTDKAQDLERETSQLLEKENALQRRIQECETRIQETSQQIQRDSRLMDAKQNEYNLTKSLVDNLEGFPESIRFLRKNAGWKKSYPLLSDILFCQEAYRVAIENFLEPVMNHYVVDEQADAVHAIRLLSDAARGKANFFILSAFETAAAQELSSAPIDDEQTFPAMEVIQVDEKYRKLCEHLLHNVRINKSSDDQQLDQPMPLDSAVILHPDGKFAKNAYSIQGGSIGLFEGKRIGRAKNLENLAKEIKVLQKETATQQDDLDGLQNTLIQLKANSGQAHLQELQFQSNRFAQELSAYQAQQEQHQLFLANSALRKQDMDREMKDIADALAYQEPALVNLQQELQQYQSDYQELQDGYAELSEELSERQAAYNQENIRFHQQQHKLSQVQKDLDYNEQQQDVLDVRITQNTSEHATVKTEITQAEDKSDRPEEDLSDMYAQRKSLEEGLQALEAAFYEERRQITTAEAAIADLRKSKENTEVIITAFKDKRTAVQIDFNALKERLAVEFSIDIRDLLDGDTSLPERDQASLEALCGKLKKQLDEFGVINSMAKEAYEEMSTRHDFIVKEKNDLLEAKNSLLSTINEIDQTAKDKFMQAFHAVRENFVTVFRSLFNEEDSCDLVLSNPQFPLESDIDIIAQPKGKRPLSINQLSGGEKTLTSTALLFALYLLKPAPFCIFDEVDAPLDDTNIDKFNNIIRQFSEQSQFIVVSHNKRTIANTDIIYGVTMVEQGISRVVAVDLRDVA